MNNVTMAIEHWLAGRKDDAMELFLYKMTPQEQDWFIAYLGYNPFQQ